MSGNPEGAEAYAMPDERRHLTEHQAILICMLAGYQQLMEQQNLMFTQQIALISMMRARERQRQNDYEDYLEEMEEREERLLILLELACQNGMLE
jgi:alpha-D-ribose 1-methylphosphonate 5-triphosphate diphosphatase PhnM